MRDRDRATSTTASPHRHSDKRETNMEQLRRQQALIGILINARPRWSNFNDSKPSRHCDQRETDMEQFRMSHARGRQAYWTFILIDSVTLNPSKLFSTV